MAVKRSLFVFAFVCLSGFSLAGGLSYNHIEAGMVSLDNGDEHGVFLGVMRKFTPEVFGEFQLDYSDLTKASVAAGYRVINRKDIGVDLYGGLEYFNFDHELPWLSRSRSGPFLGLRARKAIGNNSEFSLWMEAGNTNYFKGTEIGLRTDFGITPNLKGVISYEKGFNDRDYDTFRLGVRYTF